MSTSPCSGALPAASAASSRKLLQDGRRIAHPAGRLHYGPSIARLLAILALVSHHSSYPTVLQEGLYFWKIPGGGRMSRMLMHKIPPCLELEVIDLTAKPEVQLPLGLAAPDLLVRPPKPGSIEDVPVAERRARRTPHHEEGLEIDDHVSRLGSHVGSREVPRIPILVLTR